MPPFRRLGLYAIAGMLGCGNPATGVTIDGDVAILSGVQFTVEDGGDPFTIIEARVRGDSLFAVVQYGGGCRRHEFRLTSTNAFMESNPVQLGIGIRHRANNDLCRALLRRELGFSLIPIRDVYRRAYQTTAGVIILRLRGYTEGLRYSF
ncbi:MAG: hypothetical protein ACT4OZ_14760 [Gemmatimonadota bacterium]